MDAVGVSSAGIYIENRTMVASLFLKVPKDLFDAKVKDIYIRAIKDTFGDVPMWWPTTATCPPWPAP